MHSFTVNQCLKRNKCTGFLLFLLIILTQSVHANFKKESHFDKGITDAQVGPIYTFRHIALSMFFTFRSISVNIKNTGSETLTNLPVTLHISGVTNFNNIKNIASLSAGSATVITFDGYVTTSLGDNNITISVPDDDDNSNNTLIYTQTVNPGLVSDADDTPPSGSFGFNDIAYPGGFLYSYYSIGNSVYVNAIRIHISNDLNNIGKTVYAILVSSSSPGLILWQSAPLTISANDLGKYYQFDISPAYFNTQSAAIRAGLLQIPTPQSFNPISYQDENPRRLGASSGLMRYNGGNQVSSISFPLQAKLMIQLLINNYVLPVNLLDFKASNKGMSNALNWTSNNETNFDKYIIERSIDGHDFTPLGEIQGRGNNTSIQTHYNFTDTKPAFGLNYYRLKMVDLDGNCKYSEIKKVLLKQSLSILVYPNPVNDWIQFRTPADFTGKVFVLIKDVTGRNVIELSSNLSSGDEVLKILVSNLTSGMYIIQVYDGFNQVITGKFQKI